MASGRRGQGKGEPTPEEEAPFVDLKKLAGAVSSRTDTIEGLAEDVLVLAESTAALTSEVRMVDYRRKEDRRTNFIIYGLLSLLLITVAAALFLQYNTQQENHRLLKTVQSCTDPQGACAKRGQQQTGKAVNQLKMITLFAAECAVQHVKNPQDTIIQRCVEDKLRAAGVSTP